MRVRHVGVSRPGGVDIRLMLLRLWHLMPPWLWSRSLQVRSELHYHAHNGATSLKAGARPISKHCMSKKLLEVFQWPLRERALMLMQACVVSRHGVLLN